MAVSQLSQQLNFRLKPRNPFHVEHAKGNKRRNVVNVFWLGPFAEEVVLTARRHVARWENVHTNKLNPLYKEARLGQTKEVAPSRGHLQLRFHKYK